MLRSIQNWLNLAALRAKRAAVPARKRTAHARVELLESRNMLASTLVISGDFSLSVANDSVFGLSAAHSYHPDLSLPRFEGTLNNFDDGGLIPIPTEPWRFEEKFAPVNPPTRVLPPAASLPPAVLPEKNLPPVIPPAIVPTPADPLTMPAVLPPANSEAINPPPANSGQNNPTPPIPDAVPEGPSDSGGLVDLESETGFEGAGDTSPLNDPSPRELRSVMQLLAGLKYPVSGAENAAAIDRPLVDFDPQPRGVESVLSEADGGAIAIAVSEIADELEAARALPNIAEESLLEISVQMDRSAGRFQAFEVLTLEEPALPVREIRPTVIQQPQSDPAAVNFEGVPATDATELPTQSSSRQTSNTASGAVSVAADGAVPVTVADEKSSSTWSLTIAVVTFGFVLQLLRDRRGERLKAQAVSLWESLLAVSFGKPIPRQQRRSFLSPK